MLGWEFPPFISGGLGTACHGLVRAMVRQRVHIALVLPTDIAAQAPGETARTPRVGKGSLEDAAAPVTFRMVPSDIRSPYAAVGPDQRAQELRAGEPVPASRAEWRDGLLRVVGTGAMGGYEGNLLDRIEQYARRCSEMAEGEVFDVIHAHDWVTFPAGLAIAAWSGRPLVIHVHSTEYDRSGERVHPLVHAIERRGMHEAQAIIAVSHRTKTLITERYGVPAAKVRVVHNGIEPRPGLARGNGNGNGNGNGHVKTVLFLGRITMQKGPGFFISAAARVLQKDPDVRFVMAGWGDLGPQMIERVAAMQLGHKIRFTGFLRGEEVDRAYRMSDVYVMPSVSEPFGLTALEALQLGVPVVLSKTSGVAEVLSRGVLKVDFWDVDRMASDILAVLRRPGLRKELRQASASEVRALTWDVAARKCLEVYREQLELRPGRWGDRRRTGRPGRSGPLRKRNT